MTLHDYIRPGGENRKMEIAMKLHKKMMRWKSGTVVDGKIQDEVDLSLDDPIWKKYRTQTLYNINRYRMGSCWDFVNYQHHVFMEWEIPDESYMFLITFGGPNQLTTHTFSIITLNSQKYWFECSWKDEAGIIPVNGFQDVVKKLVDYYDPRGRRSYDVYRYDPTGLDRYLTDGKFYDRVSSGELVLQVKREEDEGESSGLYHPLRRDEGPVNTDWIAERFRL